MKLKITDELLYQYVPKADQELLDAVPDRPDPGFEPGIRHKKQIQKLLRQSRRPNRHFRYMSAARRAAVIAVLAAAVCGAVPAGAKAAERFRIWAVQQRIRNDRIEEHYKVEGTGTDRLRVFGYIPQGYQLTEEENTGETYTGQMENEKGELIVFSQAVLDDGAMVERDAALKDVHEISVRGLKLQIGIDDDGWRSAYWIDGNVYCTVVAQNLSEDELIRMIEGMEDSD